VNFVSYIFISTLHCSLHCSQLKTYRRSSRSEEDESTEVRSTLLGHCASSVDKSTDTVGLDGRAGDGATPCGSSGGSLLGLEELLLGVGGLGAVVGLAKEGAHHGEREGMAVGGADGDGRGLDGRKVWWRWMLVDSS